MYEPFLTPHLGKCTICLRMNRKRMRPVIFTVMSKQEDFRGSKIITYTAPVVISRKWCKIETLLLQITNRKQCMSCRIAPFPMTLSDLRGHLCIASYFKCDFLCSCAVVDKQDFNFDWQRVARPLCNSGASWLNVSRFSYTYWLCDLMLS